MTLDRRRFLSLAAGGVLASRLPIASLARPGERAPYKAIAFDGFPIFDPRPVAVLAESLFPGKGSAIVNAWRTRQFEYQWLRALAGHYADFMKATEDSLVFASRQLDLDLTEDKRRQLISAYAHLEVWPDVPAAVGSLRHAGLRLALLSNMTRAMMDDGLKRAGLVDTFDAVITADAIRTYKPDPRAYQLGVDMLRLKKEEILFAAFAGWDVAGAKWFGYPTFWVNRLGSPPEELDVAADASGSDLARLVEFVMQRRSA